MCFKLAHTSIELRSKIGCLINLDNTVGFASDSPSMKKLVLLGVIFVALLGTSYAQQSNRGFYRGGLSAGFILFLVHSNGALSVYTSDFAQTSSGGGTVSTTGFFSFSTTNPSKTTNSVVTGTLATDSVSGSFTPSGGQAESFTATKVPIFGSTAQVAGRYFGIGTVQSSGTFTPFTVLLDSQGRLVVNGIGTDSISNVNATGAPTEMFGDDIAQEFSGVSSFEVTGPNTSVRVCHGVMEGTFKAGGITYQFRASKESSANHLANISTRGPVSNLHTNANDPNSQQIGQLIAGFIITGGPKLVLIRVLGPSLINFLCMSGCSNSPPPWLQNPMVQLYMAGSQNPIASNDDWQTNSNASDIGATTIPPNDPKESALLVRLEAGAYTAVVSGADGGTGVAVVEVYEIDRD
jgi:hypothetical protein